jgi:hypothetical protein
MDAKPGQLGNQSELKDKERVKLTTPLKFGSPEDGDATSISREENFESEVLEVLEVQS